MAHQLFSLPRPTAISSNLTLVAGAKVGFFLTGTSTPTNTYQDSALTTPHANPVVADSAARLPAIYLDPSIVYRITFTDSADVEIYPAIDPANDQVLSQAIIGGYLYPRTAAEIAEGVTPTNYAYPPGHVYRYGTNTTPGTTDMSAAFASAALVCAPHPMRLPVASMRVNTGFVIPAEGSVIGDHWQGSIIEWYGSGACMRVVGTVNVGGANYCRFEEFKIRTRANDNYGIAALWGGNNVFRRVRFSWDSASSNRFRHACIIDQTVHTLFDQCTFQGWMKAAILGPNAGEFTDYGTSTSSYNTVVSVTDNCEFNSQYDATTTAIALDRGELLRVEKANFNATPIAIRLSRAYTAFEIEGNYFERLDSEFHATTNRGPALLIAGTSYISGASITAAVTASGAFAHNHVEWRQRQAPDNDGVIEINAGFDGVLNVIGNEFQQGFSHCVYVSGGTVKKLRFTGNEQQTANETLQGDGFINSVFIATGAAVTQLYDDTPTRVRLPTTVKEFGWGGQKILFASAVPTTSASSALETQSVAAGDLIYLEDGSGVLRVTGAGTWGSAGVITGGITNGTALLTLSAAGNVVEGARLTIVGVTGAKVVKQTYNDGSPRAVLDSNADATVAGASVAFQAPTLAPHIRSGSGTPEGAIVAPIGSTFSRSDGGASTSIYVKESGSGNTGWRAV